MRPQVLPSQGLVHHGEPTGRAVPFLTASAACGGHRGFDLVIDPATEPVQEPVVVAGPRREVVGVSGPRRHLLHGFRLPIATTWAGRPSIWAAM